MCSRLPTTGEACSPRVSSGSTSRRSSSSARRSRSSLPRSGSTCSARALAEASGEARRGAPAEAGRRYRRRSGPEHRERVERAGRRRTGDGARRTGPHRVVPRRLGPRSRRLDHGRARRDRGHRGRVGFGQEPDRDGDRGAPARTAQATSERRRLFGQDLASLGDGRPAPAARHARSRSSTRIRWRRSTPRCASAASSARSPRCTRGSPVARRGTRSVERLRSVRIGSPERRARNYPHELSGRDATAGHDRHGPDGHSSADHRGRADHSPRRHGPAADPQAAGRHRHFHRGGGDPDLARHRGRLAALPAGPRHVRGPGRRGARRRRPWCARPAHPYTARPAGVGPRRWSPTGSGRWSRFPGERPARSTIRPAARSRPAAPRRRIAAATSFRS